jgi:O-acetyl-ADP-ribose deacetylase (regulator of RNase III)
VNLNAGFDRSVSSTTPRQVLLERAAVWLLHDAGLDAEVLPADEDARRRIVTTLLTVRPPRQIDTARLREDCHRIVERQGHDEPTGTAKATRGYYLPAKVVLHTVGPIVADGRVTPEHRKQLARSYEACLDLAATIGLRSIAFCGVSTGVFGYPKREAVEVATSTVRDWLVRHPHVLDVVIFNVFTAADEEAYRHTGSERPSARRPEPIQHAPGSTSVEHRRRSPRGTRGGGRHAYSSRTSARGGCHLVTLDGQVVGRSRARGSAVKLRWIGFSSRRSLSVPETTCGTRPN